jgi:signal peptidase II
VRALRRRREWFFQLMAMQRRWKTYLWVGLVTLILDQATKYWALYGLPKDDRGIGIAVPLIQNFWEWRLSFNTGSAFGMFGNLGFARVMLTIVALVAIGVITYMLRESRNDQRRLHWALGMVAGGAVGNVIDRILYGKVTDFIVWKYYDTEWPTFNIADVALCIGVGLLVLDMTKQAKAEKAAKLAEEAAAPKPTKKKQSQGQQRKAKKKKRKR